MDKLAKVPKAVTMLPPTGSPDIIWVLDFRGSIEREGKMPGIRQIC